jgi:NAD(P)H-hydrate epimerase
VRCRPLTVSEVRAIDRYAIDVLGIPGVVLMENAGRGCAEHILRLLDARAAERVAILCGPGNNGGDGFVIARHLRLAGVAVDVILAAPPEKSVGDAGVNLRIIERMGFTLTRADVDLAAAVLRIHGAAVVVDALLGTGSQGAPRGVQGALIETASAASGRRVAIDIPSGLDADTGTVHTPCFCADLTLTMVAPKSGFAAPTAARVLGRVMVVDIGAPAGEQATAE